MQLSQFKTVSLAVTLLCTLASCGVWQNGRLDESRTQVPSGRESQSGVQSGGSILDAFRKKDRGVKVNRYLWTASLDVLNFLPMQSVDPFTGVIITGYGRPPGGGTAYRATVLISDPALDARALNVSLHTANGPVSEGTRKAVEDAILTRARQLRVESGKY